MIELMIVVAIIALLAAIVIPNIIPKHRSPSIQPYIGAEVMVGEQSGRITAELGNGFFLVRTHSESGGYAETRFMTSEITVLSHP